MKILCKNSCVFENKHFFIFFIFIYLSSKEMNNYRKGLKKRRKKKLWIYQWEPIDQKKIWSCRKGLPLTRKKKKNAYKKQNEDKKYYIWQIMRSKTLTYAQKRWTTTEKDSQEKTKKRSYGEINENLLTKQRFEVTEKGYHWLKRRRKMHTKRRQKNTTSDR